MGGAVPGVGGAIPGLGGGAVPGVGGGMQELFGCSNYGWFMLGGDVLRRFNPHTSPFLHPLWPIGLLVLAALVAFLFTFLFILSL